MGRLIGFPFSDLVPTSICFPDLARLSYFVLFQYLGRRWTAEELAMGAELQGLGPDDVEAE